MKIGEMQRHRLVGHEVRDATDQGVGLLIVPRQESQSAIGGRDHASAALEVALPSGSGERHGCAPDSLCEGRPAVAYWLKPWSRCWQRGQIVIAGYEAGDAIQALSEVDPVDVFQQLEAIASGEVSSLAANPGSTTVSVIESEAILSSAPWVRTMLAIQLRSVDAEGGQDFDPASVC
jgi:hypothetical protein